MAKLEVTKLSKGDVVPYDLLYLADESKEAVKDYMRRGTCYTGWLEGKPVGVYVLLPTRPFTVELVNLAVKKEFQGQGLGRQLIEHAIDTARKHKYKIMEVGTANAGVGQLALYQKCGFTITSVDMDFFKKHYPDPIYENGIQCLHMIRLKMDL